MEGFFATRISLKLENLCVICIQYWGVAFFGKSATIADELLWTSIPAKQHDNDSGHDNNENEGNDDNNGSLLSRTHSFFSEPYYSLSSASNMVFTLHFYFD